MEKLLRVTDIKQVQQYEISKNIKYFEIKMALGNLSAIIKGDSKFMVKDEKTGDEFVFEYGKIKGLRNLSPLSALMRVRRAELKITQEQLSAKTGVAVSKISKMENHYYINPADFGKYTGAKWDTTSIYPVCEALSISLDWVTGGYTLAPKR